MSEVSAKVRTIEPFGFWPHYTSALGGLGGEENGPDPYYCFHTPYLEYKPGGLIFRMRLIGAQATTGELALRVHAWRADGSMDAVLVGGVRIPLEGLEGDREYAVRVASLPGVIYAFFARYTQPSDLRIQDLVLTAEELADEDVDTYATIELTPSNFGTQNLRSPSHLTILSEPTLRAPLSQPWTDAQLADRELFQSLPPEIRAIAGEYKKWRAAFAWQVLISYDVAQPGASGSISTDDDSPIGDLLRQRGILVGDAPIPDNTALHDFLIETDALRGVTDGVGLANAILGKMKTLLKGGLGIFLFDAKIGGIASSEPASYVSDGWLPGEQDIQRVALKVIGHNSDIAQIAWPHDRDGFRVAPFGLVVRR